jgi:N-acyl-D-aspartate/D-glutamate deacylase
MGERGAASEAATEENLAQMSTLVADSMAAGTLSSMVDAHVIGQ